MAALAILHEFEAEDKTGRFIKIYKVKIASSSDTVSVSEGVVNVAHVRMIPINSADTAATVSSITQSAHPAGATVNLSGGTVGSEQFCIVLHHGAASGL